MIIQIEPYDALPCELKTFKINGVQADKNDFGFSDSGREFALSDEDEDFLAYGCPNNTFYRNETCETSVLEKYDITKEEWECICNELVCILDVGRCGWCI
jgi:hypothetical protein